MQSLTTVVRSIINVINEQRQQRVPDTDAFKTPPPVLASLEKGRTRVDLEVSTGGA